MLSNPRRELFARLIAYGKSATQAYIDAGFSEKGAAQSACRLRDDPEVTKRIREIQSEVGAKLEAAGIRDINERIREYQNRWQKMKDVTDSRAADPTMKHVLLMMLFMP